jgi:hypothetical protein
VIRVRRNPGHKKRSDSVLSGIFISYRSSDSADTTGRIYDRLVSELGKAQEVPRTVLLALKGWEAEGRHTVA